MNPQTNGKPRSRQDAFTRIRALIRASATTLGLNDGNGVSAVAQHTALVHLADRADCTTGEIPERFTPNMAELGRAVQLSERQARRVIHALAAAGRIVVTPRPGRQSELRVVWLPVDGDESDPGHDGSPDIAPALTSRQPTPDTVPAHPGHGVSPTPYDLGSLVGSLVESQTAPPAADPGEAHKGGKPEPEIPPVPPTSPSAGTRVAQTAKAKFDIDPSTLTPTERAAHDAIVGDIDLASTVPYPATTARDLVRIAPGVDVAREVARAGAWLRSKGVHRSNGATYLTNWISKATPSPAAVTGAATTYRTRVAAPPPSPLLD